MTNPGATVSKAVAPFIQKGRDMEIDWVEKVSDRPTVTLYKQNVAFNRAALTIMGFPERVNIGTTKDGRTVFQASSNSDGYKMASGSNQMSGRANIKLPNGKYLLEWFDHNILAVVTNE